MRQSSFPKARWSSGPKVSPDKDRRAAVIHHDDDSPWIEYPAIALTWVHDGGGDNSPPFQPAPTD